MYDPTVGRWLNLDPIGFEAGDANPIRYVGNNPTNATDPSGLQPPATREQDRRDRIFPEMSEEDLNLVSAAGWATNPDDPEGDTDVVTIAVLVVHGGAAGPGHSAMFIGPRGRGFWPKQMKTFDFGPADSKDISQGLASVPGAPYWAAKSMTNLYEVLKRLDNLTKGDQADLFITQVTLDEGRDIQDYWLDVVGYREGNTTYPNYHFLGRQNLGLTKGSLQCTTAVGNALRRGGRSVFGGVGGIALEKLDLQPITPEQLSIQLEGADPLAYSGRLKRTAGQKKETGVTLLVRKLAEDGQPRWLGPFDLSKAR